MLTLLRLVAQHAQSNTNKLMNSQLQLYKMLICTVKLQSYSYHCTMYIHAHVNAFDSNGLQVPVDVQIVTLTAVTHTYL
jgi:hypothetical protein